MHIALFAEFSCFSGQNSAHILKKITVNLLFWPETANSALYISPFLAEKSSWTQIQKECGQNLCHISIGGILNSKAAGVSYGT